jgi:preprotein translocase subunit SecG
LSEFSFENFEERAGDVGFARDGAKVRMPTEVKWAISMLAAIGLIWVGWRYTPVLVTLHIMVCFILVIVIMLQSGNAADLAGAFGGAGSQTAFGPRGAATFLSRATTWCAIVFMMTSLTLSVKRTPTDIAVGGSSILEQTTKTAPPAKPAPNNQSKPLFPVQTPTAPQQGAPPGSQNSAPASKAPASSAPASSTPAPAPAAPAPKK